MKKTDELQVFPEETRSFLLQHGYEYIRIIGAGGFSTVCLCKSLKYESEFAVKKVEYKQSEEFKECLQNGEISALLGLSHPLIIKMYEYFHDDENLYIVLEYCPGGSLKGHAPICEDLFSIYGKQILEALSFCHKKGVAHRDIKPENILIDRYSRICLADFGLSKYFDNGSRATDHVGSEMYVAPEVIKGGTSDPFAADIWSLGITFYYIATGSFPFPTYSYEALKSAILLGYLQYPTDIPIKIKQIILKMTTFNPEKRPTIEQLLQTELFRPLISSSSINVTNIPSILSYPAPTKLRSAITNKSIPRISSQKKVMLKDGESKDGRKKHIHAFSNRGSPQPIISCKRAFILPETFRVDI